MGVVYKAQDTRLDRFVALKFLPEKFARDPQALERFRREAKAASALNHPNICTVHDIGEQEGRQFIAMELLEGETLKDCISGKLLRPDRALDLAIETVDAMDAAHAKGIVHRDVKPANIFITTIGHAKILDFGLAKLAPTRHVGEAVGAAVASMAAATATADEVLTSPGTALGTVVYMSPEQVRGEDLDTRSDLFSFGAVLYEMTTGQMAFSGTTAGVIYEAILNRSPLPPSRLNSAIPAELERIIGRALEKDRALRYQTAAELRAELKRLRRDTESGRSSASTQRAPAPTRWKWLPGSILLTVVVIGSIAGYFLHRSASKTQLAGSDFQKMQIAKLTDSGNVTAAAISPDGRYVAYALKEGHQHSLWIRQVSTESAVRIVPPTPDQAFEGVSFSPDGEYVYFVQDRSDIATTAVFAVPVLGGAPRLIVSNVYSGVGVSRDGKKLAYIRGLDAPHSQLLVASSDGAGERLVVDAISAKLGKFWDLAAPSWSPDGTLIAATILGQNGAAVIVIPAVGGAPVIIPFPNASAVAWLPNQGGLLVTARTDSGGYQIWFQPYPSGERQRVSNDLNDYSDIGITAEGKSIVAIQIQVAYAISVGSASEPDAINRFGASQTDGTALAWMSDGRLLTEDRQSRFWLTAADGKERVFDFDGGAEFWPGEFTLCWPGNFILFQRVTRGIARVDINGRNLQDVSTGRLDGAADCSADGNSIIFTSFRENGAALVRVPTTGSAPQMVLDRLHLGVWGRYSPDGRRIAAFIVDSMDGPNKLAIIDSSTLKIERTLVVPGTVPNNFQGGLRWTRNGQAVGFPAVKDGATNLWIQPVAGGPARQLTHSGHVEAFDWSPDGNRLAITRLSSSSDVVLFSNFR